MLFLYPPWQNYPISRQPEFLDAVSINENVQEYPVLFTTTVNNHQWTTRLANSVNLTKIAILLMAGVYTPILNTTYNAQLSRVHIPLHLNTIYPLSSPHHLSLVVVVSRLVTPHHTLLNPHSFKPTLFKPTLFKPATSLFHLLSIKCRVAETPPTQHLFANFRHIQLPL